MLFNWLDVFICIILFVSTLISIVRGFVKEVLSLVSWILAFYVAYRYFEDGALLLTGVIGSSALRAALSFIGIFIGAVIVLGFIAYLIGKAISFSGLKSFDRVFGAAFGVLRGMLIVNLLLIVGGMLSLTSYIWWQQSFLAVKFNTQASWLKDNLPEFNERFHLYAKRSDPLPTKPLENADMSDIV